MEDRRNIDAIDLKYEYKILFKFECVEKKEKRASGECARVERCVGMSLNMDFYRNGEEMEEAFYA